MIPLKQIQGLTISSSAPATPQIGDRWLELGAGGAPLHDWEWTWYGSEWRSPLKDWTVSFVITTAQNYYLLVNPSYGYLLRSWDVEARFQAVQTTSLYWEFVIRRHQNGSSPVVASPLNTIGGDATNWLELSSGAVDISLPLPTGTTKTLGLQVNRVGTSNQLGGAFTLNYQLVRL